jgi:hypothetical protein
MGSTVNDKIALMSRSSLTSLVWNQNGRRRRFCGLNSRLISNNLCRDVTKRSRTISFAPTLRHEISSISDR